MPPLKEEQEEDEHENEATDSSTRGGEESNESRDAKDEREEEGPSEATNTEENVCGVSSGSQRATDPTHSGKRQLRCVDSQRPAF